MKRNLLRILPMLLLGGVLGLTAAPAAFQAAGVKAEDEETKIVEVKPASVKDQVGTNTYTSNSFSVGGISFLSKNVYAANNSGTYYLQIKNTNGSGFWSATTFTGYYISKVEMQTFENDCLLGLGKTSKPAGNITVTKGSAGYTGTFTQQNGYQYISIMANSIYTRVKSLKITYTKISDEPLPPFEGDYKLVEDVAELNSGDQIVLGNAANQAVSGTFGSNQYFSATAGTFGDGELTPTTPDVITLLATDGGWNLYTQAEGYIGCSEAGKLAKNAQDTWTISIADDGAATIDNGTYKIKYNKGSPRFSCYTGEPTDSMPLPEIYKAKNPSVDKFTVTYNGNGADGSTTDTTEYSIASEVTLLDSSFTAPTDKTFKEWNTKADGTGESYQPGDEFVILKNTTMYAIWKDAVIEDGYYFELVTNYSELSEGTKVLLGYNTGDNVKVNGGISNGYLSAHSFAVENNKFFVPTSNTNVKPLTLGIEDSHWTFTYDKTNKIAANKNENNSLCTSDDKNADALWTISLNGSVATIENNTSSYGKLQYNSTGSGRFSNYPSGSQANPSFYKQLGIKPKIVLDADEKEIYVDQVSTVKVADYEGFVPTSYEWSIIDGNSKIEFVGATNVNTVQFKGLASGAAKIQVKCNNNDELVQICNVTILPKEESVLEEGYYFIANYAKTNLLGSSISDVSGIDLSSNDNQWEFKLSPDGKDTYYIKSGTNYLEWNSSNGSKLQLSLAPTQYWTISKNSDNTYKITNSAASRSLSYNSGANQPHWFAFDKPSGNQNQMNILSPLDFSAITYEGALAKSTYNVGDDFDSTGLKFYIEYVGGVKVALAEKITWNKIESGTSATGTVKVSGVDRTVVVTGLTITNFEPESLTLSGSYKTDFYPGETTQLGDIVVDLNLRDSVTSATKVVTLTSDEYDFSPKTIQSDTTEITVFYKKNTSVSKSYSINVTAKTYVVANYVGVGDSIVIATLDAKSDRSNLNGGEELSYNGTTFTHEHYDYSPAGVEEFDVVAGTQAGTLALKNKDGKYLRGDQKSFRFNKADPIEGEINDGLYEFEYPISIGSNSYNVKFTQEEVGSDIYHLSYDPYPQIYPLLWGDALLEDGIGIFEYEYYSSETVEGSGSGELAYKYDGGYILVDNPNTPAEEITDDACWYINYDKDNEVWNLSNYLYDADNYKCQYNTDGAGKFGFYNNFENKDIVIYRNNTKPLKNKCTSISIDTSTIKTEYEVGDVFQWTGLDVTAYYEGGMFSSVPLGGYEISTPDMSTAGTKTITVSYGALDNIVTKTFTITVSDPTPVKPTIVSVSLTKNPSKTTYFPGETIIFDGEITAHMSDGSDEVLDNDEWIKNINPNTAGGVGYHTITVNIKNTSGKYVQFGISVIAVPSILENISISGQKTDYWTGEAFEPSGVVKAHYSGGTTKTVTPTQYSEVDTSTPGTKTVTVYYTEGTITVTCSYNITVKDKPTIVDYTISGGKREFVLGESFSQGNLSVTVKYSDGTERSDVPFNVDSTHFDGTKLGTYEIFVTVPEYSGEVKSYTVTVNKALINNIELRYTSSKVDAKPGDQQEIIFKKPDPTGEYFDYDDFTYESSNFDIAEVQMINGVPTIVYKDYGNCVITIKAKAGSGVATYQVNVLKHVTGISLDKAEAEVNINETLTLNATITPADADDKKVIWTSSNESIAIVDANGVVTGIKEGTVTITATANDKVLGTKSASCEVTVKKVPVTSVTLDKITEEALVGDKFKLNATVEPDNATFPKVKWSSSNEKVAKVDQNGNVTCVKEGVATITVINEDSGLSATCVVTVSKIDVESVAINKETLDLVVGNNETLVATVSPDNATYKDVTWSSSDTSVAKVDANGKVTAVAPGTATITVKTNDGEKVATCTVTVRAIPVESVSLNETTAKLDIGQTLDLVATVTPENATNKDVTFSTSNADIATVDENGKVTAVAVGEVTITVTTADGAKTATCTVTVYDKAAQTKKNLIVLGAASGGVIVVGAGCGIGIPLGLKAKKRKLHK